MLLLLSLLLAGCLSSRLPPARTPAERCGLSPTDLAPGAQPAADRPAAEISVWARAYANWCWRAYLPVLAAPRVPDFTITVQPTPIQAQHSAYRRIIEQAAAAGNAPDIVLLHNVDVAHHWVEAGYLAPLDECVDRHPEFDAVIDELWTAHQIQDRTWVLPIETHLAFLFFSKNKLRALGWSEAEIAALPAAIRQGEFTLTDLMMLARQAVQRGVVEPGYAFWPDWEQRLLFELLYNAYSATTDSATSSRAVDGDGTPPLHRDALVQTLRHIQQLVDFELMPTQFVDAAQRKWPGELIRQDVLAHGRVLFWIAPNYEWSFWGSDFAYPHGGYPYLHDTLGYALFPAHESTQTGRALWIESSFYAITSPTASGRHQQDAACALLAQTFDPTLLTRLTAKSATASTIRMDSAPREQFELLGERQSQYQAETEYMWNFAQSPPPLPAARPPQDSWFDSVVFESMVLVARGELSPQDAADMILRTHRGDWTPTTDATTTGP